MAICRLASIALLSLLSIPYVAAQAGPADNNSVDREIRSGDAALHQGNYEEAKQHFEKAESVGGPRSAAINAGIAIAELQMEHYEAARQRESKVLELVSNDHDRAEAYNLIGTSWLRESSQANNTDMLKSAEESFRHAVKLDPIFDSAYFNLGNTLLHEKREEDAAAAFKSFIEAAAKNPAYDQNLPTTPQSPAPQFTITDSEGHVVSSDSLRGRFVLLDFWATWCAPCIRALPGMRQLARYFPSGQFTLISVSENTVDQKVWRNFIVQQKMDWTQLWDTNLDLYYKFRLAPRPDVSIPRYVLIDGNGFVRRVYNGTDHFGMVVGQIAKIVAAAPAASPGQVGAQPSPIPEKPNSQ